MVADVVTAASVALAVLTMGWVATMFYVHRQDVKAASAGDFLLDQEAKR
ncbi:MAG: hypothetical protein WC876_04445 [Candidatus Thermoplasmatota archaeon]|jgi:hypothetical protein